MVFEFVSAEAPLGIPDSFGIGEHRICREEVDEIEGVLLVIFEDRSASRFIGGGPAFGSADRSQRELLSDRVVAIDFFVGNIVGVETYGLCTTSFGVTTHHFKTCGIVVLWHWHCDAVLRVFGQRQPVAVCHDVVIAVTRMTFPPRSVTPAA